MSTPDTVERMAKKIYDVMPYDGESTKPNWVPNGNSTMQDRARDCARDIITETLNQLLVLELKTLGKVRILYPSLEGIQKTIDEFNKKHGTSFIKDNPEEVTSKK